MDFGHGRILFWVGEVIGSVLAFALGVGPGMRSDATLIHVCEEDDSSLSVDKVPPRDARVNRGYSLQCPPRANPMATGLSLASESHSIENEGPRPLLHD